ncbi:MAG: energy transducer TonB [Pyrinomonadaceae bacterium]
MRYCPFCETRYDEEIIRFCTKDGTPLVDDTKPNFVEMPSESLPEAVEDDPRDITVIRRSPAPPIDPAPDYAAARPSTERVVIPTTPDLSPQTRRQTSSAYGSPKGSNTGKVVLLTVLGTLVVLGGAGVLFWFLQQDPVVMNANVNVNSTNLNSDTNSDIIDSNFNFNINANTNVNANANIKTPTPTPKKTPSPSPTASPTPDSNTNTAPNTNTDLNSNTRPTATPTPAPPSNTPVNAGSLNSRAINLPTPAYPAAARSMRAGGQVAVQVTLDESGNVISARATSGHPLLRRSAEDAARRSRFNPVLSGGRPAKATGFITYNFINN